jgi:hypothetical protein
MLPHEAATAWVASRLGGRWAKLLEEHNPRPIVTSGSVCRPEAGCLDALRLNPYTTTWSISEGAFPSASTVPRGGALQGTVNNPRSHTVAPTSRNRHPMGWRLAFRDETE